MFSPGSLEKATSVLIDTYDQEHGGWGRAPKFPQSMTIDSCCAGAAVAGGQQAGEGSHVLPCTP